MPDTTIDRRSRVSCITPGPPRAPGPSPYTEKEQDERHRASQVTAQEGFTGGAAWGRLQAEGCAVIALGLGTCHGLFRKWWVVINLMLTVAMALEGALARSLH